MFAKHAYVQGIVLVHSLARRSFATSPAYRHAQPVPKKAIQTRINAKVRFLIDTFLRRHDYLRISLTERCNLRCFYCMPSDGIELSPKAHILTDDEVLRLATLFVKNGVTKIRLTGGEPTVRKGLDGIISRLNQLRIYGLKSIGMTTNGIALHRRLPTLVENGLTHLNISLDTLDPFKFEIMTRRPGHEAVLRSIEVAKTLPELQSLKLNVVVIKGLNDGEVLDFLEMTKDEDISVRFIEFMPFTGNRWDQAKMLPSSELLDRIIKRHSNVVKASDELNDTARSYRIPGYKGSFGFISSMSDHFCGSCNRLRLTADGQIKVCLFDAKEISLRDQMRQGASDDDLLQTIGLAVRGKQEKHAGMEDIDVVTNRPMILIGGRSSGSGMNPRSNPTKSRSPVFVPLTHHHRLLERGFEFRNRRYNSTSATPDGRLTHIDSTGRPTMVDVSSKAVSKRTATAIGRIYIPKSAYDLIVPSETQHNSAVNNDITASNPAQQARVRSKGDVLTVAQLAAIMGCKRTSDLIPLCHPLPLSQVAVRLIPNGPRTEEASQDMNTDSASPASEVTYSRGSQRSPFSIICEATVTCDGKTGVEMEALTAVSVGLLTVWDMLKAIAGKEMVIGDILVSKKAGGKSGDWTREGEP
ncbi:molybdenum cofactor biosynthesis prote [Panus rudis PR-1116 ss-1]|nr:molybdenum cofactor biosynthesis prote [Panus rudis PR-1116 ss-1]